MSDQAQTTSQARPEQAITLVPMAATVPSDFQTTPQRAYPTVQVDQLSRAPRSLCSPGFSGQETSRHSCLHVPISEHGLNACAPIDGLCPCYG